MHPDTFNFVNRAVRGFAYGSTKENTIPMSRLITEDLLDDGIQEGWLYAMEKRTAFCGPFLPCPTGETVRTAHRDLSETGFYIRAAVGRARSMLKRWEASQGQKDTRARSDQRTDLDCGFRVDSNGFLHRVRPRAGKSLPITDTWDQVSNWASPLELVEEEEAMRLTVSILTDEQRLDLDRVLGDEEYPAHFSRHERWLVETSVRSRMAEIIGRVVGAPAPHIGVARPCRPIISAPRFGFSWWAYIADHVRPNWANTPPAEKLTLAWPTPETVERSARRCFSELPYARQREVIALRAECEAWDWTAPDWMRVVTAPCLRG